MPATSERQIYNFENAIERAVEGVLEAQGLTAFIQGQGETLPPSRVEITAATGAALNEAIYPLDESKTVYDFYDARLTLRIVTERPSDQPSLLPGVSMLHEEWAAAVRVALQERLNPFTPANLPYLTVKTIRPAGTSRELDPRWLEDYTRLDYVIQFGIRSDAWPVS